MANSRSHDGIGPSASRLSSPARSRTSLGEYPNCRRKHRLKWAALTKSSQDTALRDIQQLVERRVLVRNAGGGRSTSYSLADPSR